MATVGVKGLMTEWLSGVTNVHHVQCLENY